MGRRFAVLLVATVAALGMAAMAIAGNGGRPLSTEMTGAQEVPGPGDPDATGTADLRLNQGQGRICFDIDWANIDGTVFAAHIHFAPVGVAGPIVVPLFSGSFAGTDEASGCVQGVDRALVKAIRKNPSAYYVNVHSQPDFPNGAIRGQLSK
jgi:hypothetical protein